MVGSHRHGGVPYVRVTDLAAHLAPSDALLIRGMVSAVHGLRYAARAKAEPKVLEELLRRE